jgi:hypothetical protein
MMSRLAYWNGHHNSLWFSTGDGRLFGLTPFFPDYAAFFVNLIVFKQDKLDQSCRTSRAESMIRLPVGGTSERLYTFHRAKYRR